MFRSVFRPQVSGPRRVLRGWCLLGLTLGLLAGCQNNDCLKSAGDETTERRELPPFHDLTAEDNVNVTVVQDSETFAEVRTGANLQEDLKVEVRGERLYISNESRCNWARSYDVVHEVTLHVPQLVNVALNGQGNVRTAGSFRADTMFVHLKGSGDFDLDLRCNYLWMDQYELGDINLRGQTNELHLTGGGLGRFFASSMNASRCFLNLSVYADGDTYLRAKDGVVGTHAGPGTIYLAGNPPFVGVQITGRGSLEKLD